MSILVIWGEVAPNDRNGVITRYQVLYQPLQTFEGAIREMSVNVTGLSVTLTGLEEYVDYSISVRAFTSIGEGPYSNSTTEKTHEDGNVVMLSILYVSSDVHNCLLLFDHLQSLHHPLVMSWRVQNQRGTYASHGAKLHPSTRMASSLHTRSATNPWRPLEEPLLRSP